GSADGTIRLWDPTSARQRTVLLGHPAQVQAVAFAPDSQMLASGGADRVVRLWDLEEHREETYPLPRSRPGPVRLTPHASRLAYGEVVAVKQWDWATGLMARLPSISLQVEELATAEGALASLDIAGRVHVWRNGRPIINVDTRAGLNSPLAVRALALSAGG